MLAALELPEGTLDLLGDVILPVVEPFVLGAKNLQSPADDLIGILVRSGLDCILVLGPWLSQLLLP